MLQTALYGALIAVLKGCRGLQRKSSNLVCSRLLQASKDALNLSPGCCPAVLASV